LIADATPTRSRSPGSRVRKPKKKNPFSTSRGFREKLGKPHTRAGIGRDTALSRVVSHPCPGNPGGIVDVTGPVSVRHTR
jgi:hypothetical protein